MGFEASRRFAPPYPGATESEAAAGQSGLHGAPAERPEVPGSSRHDTVQPRWQAFTHSRFPAGVSEQRNPTAAHQYELGSLAWPALTPGSHPRAPHWGDYGLHEHS